MIGSRLRMARKNKDKLMDTRTESKLKDNRRTSHRSPNPVAESQTFPDTMHGAPVMTDQDSHN